MIIEVQGSYTHEIEAGHTTGTAVNGFGFGLQGQAGGVISRKTAWRLVGYLLKHLMFNWNHIRTRIKYKSLNGYNLGPTRTRKEMILYVLGIKREYWPNKNKP